MLNAYEPRMRQSAGLLPLQGVFLVMIGLVWDRLIATTGGHHDIVRGFRNVPMQLRFNIWPSQHPSFAGRFNPETLEGSDLYCRNPLRRSEDDDSRLFYVCKIHFLRIYYTHTL
jgi:hypothetical protein